MALIKCNECGWMVSDRSTFCPNCGHKIENAVQQPSCQQPTAPPPYPPQQAFRGPYSAPSARKNPPYMWPVIIAVLAVILIVVAAVIVWVVNQKNSKAVAVEREEVEVVVDADAEAQPVEEAEAAIPVTSDNDAVVEVLYAWNDCHNERDFDRLEQIYAPMLHFYTQDVSNHKAVELFKSLLKDDWTQTIDGQPVVETLSDTEKKVSFMKRTESKGKVHYYPSYLVVKKLDGRWRVTYESDDITDENVARKAKR